MHGFRRYWFDRQERPSSVKGTFDLTGRVSVESGRQTPVKAHTRVTLSLAMFPKSASETVPTFVGMRVALSPLRYLFPFVLIHASLLCREE